MFNLRYALLLLCVFSITVSAQNKFALNIMGGVNTAIGELSDTYELGFGGKAELFYSTSSSNDITLSIGYNKWNKDNLSFSTVPVLAGFRQYFPALGLKFYIPGYLGIQLYNFRSKTANC